jgi:hypothetical protein
MGSHCANAFFPRFLPEPISAGEAVKFIENGEVFPSSGDVFGES